MDPRKLIVALGLAGLVGALLFARRAQAAPLRRPERVPIGPADFGEIRIVARPLVIQDLPPISAPLSLYDQFNIALGDAIGPAVDQIKDSLKGLGLWSRKVPERYRELFAMAGSQYRLPPGLLEAVAYRESRFRDDIISGELKSSAGAVGIMQIVPKWHPELGEAGALDPARAVPYAAGYLRQLFVRFGTWKHALAAYNWGPTALANAIAAGKGGVWPAETIAYVAEIAANAGLA